MNLSKTAKRFLSSTMAIALAGGSVLAFRNSALAEPPKTPTDSGTFDFSSTVAQECALITASGLTEYTPSYNTITLSDGTTTEERTSQLLAQDSIKFDCNTAKVDVTIGDYDSDFVATVGGGNGAADLQGTNDFKYAINDTVANDGKAVPTVSTTIEDQDTDATGDIEFNVESKWTPKDGAPELAAGTYSAQVTFTVTAD